MVKGSHMTDEQRAKISAANMGRKAYFRTDEQNAWQSAVHMNPSAELREKNAAAQRGKKLSPETRAKISASNMGRTFSLESRAKTSVAKWRCGKQDTNRRMNSRRRTLGFVPLNDFFEGSDAHHVSKEYVVYVPKDLHRSVRHNIWSGHNMEQINLLALGYLVQQLEATT